jgi:hypothetical protein
MLKKSTTMRKIMLFFATVALWIFVGIGVSALANLLYRGEIAVGPVLPTAFGLIGAGHYLLLLFRPTAR